MVLGLAALGLVLPTGTIAAQAEPPRVATQAVLLDVGWFAVGESRSLDVSRAFVGAVDSYTASSNNTAVSVSVTGSVVTFTAVSSGIAYVEIRAANAAGSASRWIGMVSYSRGGDSTQESAEGSTQESAEDSTQESAEGSTGDAEDQSAGAAGEPLLRIALSSRAYCAAERPGDVPGRDPGDADPARDRDQVVRFAVNYAVIGGTGPYTVRSPHASADAGAASGVLQVACANPRAAGAGSGYRLDTYDPVEVVVEVTDAAGDSVSARLRVELGLGTRMVNQGGNMRSLEPWVAAMDTPENNYVIAGSAGQTLVTLLPNVDLRFVALGDDGVAHFADAGGGSEVWVNWATGAVVDTVVVVTGQTYAHHYDITRDEVLAAGSLWPWEIPPQPGEEIVEDMEPALPEDG